MLNSEIEEVVNALRVNEAKIKSKGIKSIRSRVANIQEFLEEPMDIETFKQRILTSIFKQQGSEDVEEYHLTDEDWDNINELSKNKYQNGNGITVRILNTTLKEVINLIEDLSKLN